MNHMQIREAEITDAEAITSLVNRAYRPAPGAEGWTHESALVSGSRVDHENVASAIQSSTVLVGSREQKPVGCVQVEMQGNAAHIGMLAVDPSLQTSGIGKLLLERAEEFAVQKYDAEVAILIVIAARTELVEFYLRRGYRLTGEQLQYPVNAGVGTPAKEAMLLTKLKKCFNNRPHSDRFSAAERRQRREAGCAVPLDRITEAVARHVGHVGPGGTSTLELLDGEVRELGKRLRAEPESLR